MTPPERKSGSDYKDSKMNLNMDKAPLNQIIKINGIIRAYKYKTWKSPKFDLTIYNGAFSNKIYSLMQSQLDRQATIFLDGNQVCLKKDNSGNKIYARKVAQTSSLSIGKILSQTQKKRLLNLFKNNKNHCVLKVKIKIIPNEWGLKFHEFFVESKEEQELVKSLSKRFTVQTITAGSILAKNFGNADIIIQQKEINIPLEITTYSPSKRIEEIKKGNNAPHGVKWCRIGARILPLLIYSTNNKSLSIIVINSEWERYSHTTSLKTQLRNLNCHIIFTDFKDNWANNVLGEIEKLPVIKNVVP
jgi:hypothetical protein